MSLIRTVGDLKAALAALPDDLSIGYAYGTLTAEAVSGWTATTIAVR